ncbi:MAG: ECF transporter S component, partial [Armatimonadota bacterium]
MRYSARDLALGGLFGATGVALPIVFHAVGLGKAFLPMHLPVLVCGLLISPTVAFAVGVVTPLVSSVLTGMPPLV